jgi:YgiT-type zinc finger domain-containing protein
MHTCSNCHIGTLQRKMGTYAARHAEQFVVIPSLPIWICDVCGERTYDGVVLNQLLPLIGLPMTMADQSSAAGLHPSADAPPSFTSERTRRRA